MFNMKHLVITVKSTLLFIIINKYGRVSISNENYYNMASGKYLDVKHGNQSEKMQAVDLKIIHSLEMKQVVSITSSLMSRILYQHNPISVLTSNIT